MISSTETKIGKLPIYPFIIYLSARHTEGMATIRLYLALPTLCGSAMNCSWESFFKSSSRSSAASISEVIFLILSGLYCKFERLLEVHFAKRREIEIIAEGRLLKIGAGIVIGGKKNLTVFNDIISE